MQCIGDEVWTVVHRNTRGGPPHRSNVCCRWVTGRSAVIDRSTMCSIDCRVCPVIINAIFMAFPSTVRVELEVDGLHHLRCVRRDLRDAVDAGALG